MKARSTVFGRCAGDSGAPWGGVGRVLAPVGSDRWRSTGQQIGIYRIDDLSMVHAHISIRVVNELVPRVRRTLDFLIVESC